MGLWDLWTGLKIRLMSSVGVQLYVWAPASTVYPIEVEPTYEREEEERITAARSAYPSLRGYRARLRLVMETLSGHIAASGVNSTLETVINAELANVGSYFEVALHLNLGVPTSNPDWKRCNLQPPGMSIRTLGKQCGIRATLDFEGAALQQTAPPRDNGSTW